MGTSLRAALRHSVCAAACGACGAGTHDRYEAGLSS